MQCVSAVNCSDCCHACVHLGACLVPATLQSLPAGTIAQLIADMQDVGTGQGRCAEYRQVDRSHQPGPTLGLGKQMNEDGWTLFTCKFFALSLNTFGIIIQEKLVEYIMNNVGRDLTC